MAKRSKTTTHDWIEVCEAIIANTYKNLSTTRKQINSLLTKPLTGKVKAKVMKELKQLEEVSQQLAKRSTKLNKSKETEAGNQTNG
jgi:hypothetical protein